MARMAWNEFDGSKGVGAAITLNVPTARQPKAAVQGFALLHGALHVVALWHERALQRRALAELDERLLRDLGITRCDAEMESSKPFWR
jgi:uncharacterized protein YjiS (DUF1127 family)